MLVGTFLLATVLDPASPANFRVLFEQHLATLETQEVTARPGFVRAVSDYALFLKSIGDKAGAERELRRAIAAVDAAVPVDAGFLATLCEELAALGGVDGATWLSRAVSIRASLPPAPELARLYSKVAASDEARNDMDGAIRGYRRALAAYERALPNHHPWIAIAANDLGLALETKEEFREAEALYRRALALQERALGPHHPEVGVTLNNLAGALGATGRLAQAEPLLRRSLAILESTLGPRHPRVATALSNLGDLLAATGRRAAARPLYGRAVRIYEAAGDTAGAAAVRARSR